MMIYEEEKGEKERDKKEKKTFRLFDYFCFFFKFNLRRKNNKKLLKGKKEIEKLMIKNYVNTVKFGT